MVSSLNSKTALCFAKLPLEVKVDIFLCICDLVGFLGPRNKSRQVPPRLNLQLVCRNWRNIISGTSVLWNNLTLYLAVHSGRGYDVPKWILHAKLWLCHAETSLISLELSISGSEDSHDQLLFAFLRGYRFKKLIITTPGPRFLDFNQTLNQSLSSVETLTLCLEGLRLPARLLSSPPPFSALKCLEISIGENEHILSAFHGTSWTNSFLTKCEARN